jgi:arylsulfatase A-like enzyme
VGEDKIDRREFLAAAGCAALSLSACDLSPPSGRGSGRPPNILFIITDDQSRDQFNFLPEGRSNGRPLNLTPNIDRLASEGVVFSNQHVSSSVCTPSRYSCLTGRYASHATNGHFLRSTTAGGQTVVGWNTAIQPATETLARMLRNAGYATGAVGKNHVIETPRFRVPIDADPTDPEVARRLKENYDEIIAAYRACGFDSAASIYNQNLTALGPRALAHHNLDWIVDGALDFIDANAERPFFLYFATTVPHGPARDWSWRGDPRVTPLGLLDTPPSILPPRDSIPRRLEEAGVDPARGDMLWLDDSVGALLAALERQGVLGDTVIFYFNDHGVETGKGTLYQGGVHSESFVWSRRPGFEGGRVVDALVSNVDFAPTILDLCGLPHRGDPHDGQSLVPLLEGRADEVHDSLYFEIGFTRAVRKGRWKYIALRVPEEVREMPVEERRRKLDAYIERCKRLGKEYHNTDPIAPFGHLGEVPGGNDIDWRAQQGREHYFAEDQLYDLEADPHERVNLAGDPAHKAKLDELKAELSRHLAGVPGTFAEFKE